MKKATFRLSNGTYNLGIDQPVVDSPKFGVHDLTPISKSSLS